jgi:hypothetical protein
MEKVTQNKCDKRPLTSMPQDFSLRSAKKICGWCNFQSFGTDGWKNALCRINAPAKGARASCTISRADDPLPDVTARKSGNLIREHILEITKEWYYRRDPC